MHFSYKDISAYATSHKARKKDGMTILDGIHLLQEAILHGEKDRLVKVFVAKSAQYHREIDAFLDTLPENIYEIIDDMRLKKIATTKTPQGIVGLYRVPQEQKITAHDLTTIILLDRVADPGNVGTIIRTALAMGTDAIFLSVGCADAWSPKVLRSAQGAQFSLPIYQHYELTEIKNVFDGIVYGTFLDAQARSLYETTFPQKTALCFGNEGTGIDRTAFALYGDKKIFIPMDNGFESLNVGISVAMCLSERRRQQYHR